MKTRLHIGVLVVLTGFVGLIVGSHWRPHLAHAQAPTEKRPTDLTAAPTTGGNFVLFRMWDDGSIDVRLVNPVRDSLTFQEKWRPYQVGP